MTLYVGYIGASATCSGGPQPGCVALMAWFLAAYKAKGARNDGIYNCRSIRGSVVPSVHGEGRAADLGCAAGDVWAQQLANALVAKSAELGVQCVIFNGHIWSGQYPTAGWRAYHGIDAHTTHIHTELSWASARSLTVARVVSVLQPSGANDGGPAGPFPVPATHLYGPNGSGNPTWHDGTGSYDGNPERYAVQQIQRETGAKPVDGIYGPATVAAVRAWQQYINAHAGPTPPLRTDGFVDAATWAVMSRR